MGRVKDWEMEQEARGWWSVPGKYVYLAKTSYTHKMNDLAP
jgi:hypothetical protein